MRLWLWLLSHSGCIVPRNLLAERGSLTYEVWTISTSQSSQEAHETMYVNYSVLYLIHDACSVKGNWSTIKHFQSHSMACFSDSDALSHCLLSLFIVNVTLSHTILVFIPSSPEGLFSFCVVPSFYLPSPPALFSIIVWLIHFIEDPICLAMSLCWGLAPFFP